MTGGLPPDDWVLVLRLVAVLALGTWAARPLALRLVPGGGAWIAALLLSWAALGWVPWAVAALGLMPFGAAALSGLAALLALRGVAGPPPAPDPRGALALAGGFALLFWLGLAQRLARADLSGLEKFTNMSFLSAVMRADGMPPQDAWFAGEGINYYYVGQAMTGAWGHLAGASPAQAYQLGMATLFALTGLGIWRLVAGLAAPFGARIAAVLGGAAAVLALYGGNLHSVLYTLARDWMPATNPRFHFPDSTRFIGFDPPTADRAFTEFPAYAFAVGDLHAHVIATPVFLLGLLVVLAILAQGRADAPRALALGWVLGLLAAINAWDVAILGLVAALVWASLALRPGSGTLARLDALGAAGVWALAAAALTAAPFLGHFVPFASGIEPAPARTPHWQLLVLHGHALPALALLAALVVAARGRGAGLFPVALVLTAAVLLIALPEVVIVRDIYGLDYARANTMFKLGFRAQTLLMAGVLAALAPAVRRGGPWLAAALLAAVLPVSTLDYARHIAAPPGTIRSLDGLAFLGEERALVAAAAGLALAPGEALVEASGPAFGESGRVSALTGLPTVVGWAGHQWLWRGDPDRVYARVRQVAAFYTNPDPAERCRIVQRFGLRYAILGQVEARQYPELQAEAIRALGPVIYAGPGGEIVQIDPARCP